MLSSVGQTDTQRSIEANYPKQDIEDFLKDRAEFRTWENVDGRTVEAALYSQNGDALTLVRRDGLLFTLDKSQLAERHHEIPPRAFLFNESSAAAAEQVSTLQAAKTEPPPRPEAANGTTGIPSIEDGIADLVAELGSELKEVSAVGVTRFYLNGSSHHTQSSHFLNRTLSELLRQGSFEVFDRSSLSVVMEEDKLEFLNQGTLRTELSSSEAIVVGNLLFSDTCSEAFLAIRAISTINAQVLFARSRRVQISRDNMERLELAYRDFTEEALPRLKPQSETDYIESLKMAAQKVRSFSLVSDAPASSSITLLGRMGYFISLETASSFTEVLYDRDLLLTLFEESATISENGLSLEFGDALISVDTGSLTDKKLILPIKIYHRDNTALLGICDLAFNEGVNQDIDTAWDDSFAAVRQHMTKLTEINADDLQYEYTFSLKNHEIRTQAISFYPQILTNPNLALITEPNSKNVIQWTSLHYYSEYKEKNMFSESKFVDVLGALAKRLVAHNPDEQLARREIIGLLILGFGINDSSDKFFPGLWLDSWAQIGKNVTISREGEAVYRTWFDAIEGAFINWAKSPNQPYRGVRTDRDIEFNYSIDFQFKGIYPEWVTLQIDLTPMKDRLYKVIKNENPND